MGECFIRRRKKKSGIPYKTVDYIRFDGTANSKLDTGIPMSSSPGEEIEITFDIEGRTYQGLFSLNGYRLRMMLIFWNTSTGYQYSTGASQSTFKKSNTGKHTFIANRNSKNYFDGEGAGNYTPQSAVSNHYLVGYYYNSNNNHNPFLLDGKIYEWKIKSNETNEYLQWLIPVQYDDSGTTKYGFYDKVSKTLFTNDYWTGGNDT